MTADAPKALFAFAAILACAGCTGPVNARSLDRICAVELAEGQACQISLLGKAGSGVTGDSIAFRLRDGTLTIHLAAVPELRAPGPFDIEVLAVAEELEPVLDISLTWGSCAEGCPEDPPLASVPLSDEHAWIKALSGIRGVEADAVLPYDAELRLSGVETQIVDLRVVATP